MLALNHAATGAIIGLKVANPWVALPLAFGSHFVLDTLPHFGYKTGGFGYSLKQKLTKYAVALDALGGIILLIVLWGSPILVFAAGFAAVLPDIINIYRFLVVHKRADPPAGEQDPLTKFHKKIQKFERPWGLIIDMLYFLLMIIIIQNMQ